MNINNMIPFNNNDIHSNINIINNINNINNIINNNINNININPFKNFSPNYGKELSQFFIEQNLIKDYDKLKKHYYYGFSGINPNNPLVKQFHIVKYNDINNGFFTVIIMFSLFYRVENNIRTIFWTYPLLDTHELNNFTNKKFYKLPNHIMKDMIYQDNLISNDNKLAMIQRFYEIDQISENSFIKCSICWNNPINKVLVCGHTICSSCIQHHSYDKCHICRTPITDKNIDIRPLFLG